MEIYNINDFSDAVEMADENDIIMFSERGNALIHNIRLTIHNDTDEFNHIRKRFYLYFREFHEKGFNY